MPVSTLLVVMYHYIRPLGRTRFPRIKGITDDEFRFQVRYLKKNYTIVCMEEVIDASTGHHKLPPNACVLTFDDGYTDHFCYAYPVLMDENLTGAFYAPRSTALERRVLDVNKVHFILANTSDVGVLVRRVEDMMESARHLFSFPSREDLRTQFRVANRFDPAEVIYLKRLLQHALPLTLRSQFTTQLFTEMVSPSEGTFAEELYMSLDQMRLMRLSGMHFGGHGDKHVWLSRMDAAGQKDEIDAASTLLDKIGMASDARTFCYPYGDYDATTIELLRNNGYRLAFTSAMGIADLGNHRNFELSRYDTNDLPKAP